MLLATEPALQLRQDFLQKIYLMASFGVGRRVTLDVSCMTLRNEPGLVKVTESWSHLADVYT